MDEPLVLHRPIPEYARQNPETFIRILRVCVRDAEEEEFVLKVSTPSASVRSVCMREGAVYENLKDEPRVVECVFFGGVKLSPDDALIGFKVRGTPLKVPPRMCVEIRSHFSMLGVDSEEPELEAIATVYKKDIVSMEQHIRTGGTFEPSFTHDAIATIKGLYERHRFVHWDLHHHNQLVNRTDMTMHVVDLDLATTRRTERNAEIRTILPLHHFMNQLRLLSPSRAFRTHDLGHKYDMVMLYSAHRSVMDLTASGRTSKFVPATPSLRRNYRFYEIARDLVSKTNWKRCCYGIGVSRTKYRSVMKHCKLLLTAMISLLLGDCNLGVSAVKSHLGSWERRSPGQKNGISGSKSVRLGKGD